MKKVIFILSLVFIISITFNQASEAQTNKRWSPQAKGTVIGAGAGAAAGAIIHKRNRVVGGVVGGVAGGATGYAIGKRKDNKNKEAARIAAANRAAEANRIAAANRAKEAKTAVASTKVIGNNRAGGIAPQALQATSGSLVYGGNNNIVPAINSAYLPNNFYGDKSKPYHTSEIKRKSW